MLQLLNGEISIYICIYITKECNFIMKHKPDRYIFTVYPQYINYIVDVLWLALFLNVAVLTTGSLGLLKSSLMQ